MELGQEKTSDWSAERREDETQGSGGSDGSQESWRRKMRRQCPKEPGCLGLSQTDSSHCHGCHKVRINKNDTQIYTLANHSRVLKTKDKIWKAEKGRHFYLQRNNSLAAALSRSNAGCKKKKKHKKNGTACEVRRGSDHQARCTWPVDTLQK